MWLILFTAAIGLSIYWILTRKNFFEKRGITYAKPYPLFGNLIDVVLQRKALLDIFDDLYNMFPNERYIGIFQFTSESLLIRDIDIVKQICVKNFDNFVNHRNVGNPVSDDFFSKSLTQLHDQSWKDMRSTLSPAFTGSKMKAMFPLMTECAEQMSKYFLEKAEKVHELEMKDLFTRYTNDVIATCAFGITCDSIKDRENTFYMTGKDATDFNGLRGLKILIASFAPRLFNMLNMEIFPIYIKEFFVNTIKESIAYRTSNNVVRPDMIHLLMEARKGNLKHEDNKDDFIDKGFAVIEESSLGKEEVKTLNAITDVDIAAQAFVFFFAGFDTASTLMSFMSYELALNLDVQTKLQKEIDDVMDKCNNKITYEDVMGMKYLDMVVSESLRKWPPGPITDRNCNKDFTIKPTKPGEKPYTIKTGESITIPIYGFHRDAQYFPNPQKFDPERFSDENKHNILPYSYLPFGIGPRSCIGNRFALLEVKIVFVHFLAKFKFVPVEKTVIPIKMTKKSFRLEPDEGFWIGFEPRK